MTLSQLRLELGALQHDLTRRMEAVNATTGPDAVSGVCTTCRLPIIGDTAGCVVFDAMHHRACLSCDDCKVSLAQTGCYLSGRKILCRHHYLVREARSCSACREPIDGSVVQVNPPANQAAPMPDFSLLRACRWTLLPLAHHY